MNINIAESCNFFAYFFISDLLLEVSQVTGITSPFILSHLMGGLGSFHISLEKMGALTSVSIGSCLSNI